MREGAQAVDARVRPEVDEDHPAAESRERERPPTRCVQPECDPPELRRASAPGRCCRDAGFGQLPELPPSGRSAFDPCLESFGVAGQRRGEPLVDAEPDEQRGRADDEARGLACDRRVRADDRHARAETLPADGDGEHRPRCPESVRGRYEDDAEADVAACSERRDRGEDRARARHEDETDAQADDEAVRVSGGPPPGQEQERSLEEPRDPLGEKARGEDEERGDGSVA